MSDETMRSGREVLRLCLRHTLQSVVQRRAPDSNVVAAIRKRLAPPLDWPRFIEEANRHRVIPLLYQGVMSAVNVKPGDIRKEGGQGLTSEDGSSLTAGLSSLHRLYQANSVRTVRLTETLFEILDFFTRANIRAVPFKGPVLAQTLYGHMALRQMADVDFMIHPDDLGRAKALLVSRGYRPQRELTAAEESVWERTEGGYDMANPERDFTVDIRSRITPDYLPFRLNPDEVWRDVRDVTVEGRMVKTFSPELNLLLVCYHGAKHLWHRLAWIADVGLSAQSPALDEKKAQALAEKSGGRRLLQLGLGMAETILDMPLTAGMKEWKDRHPLPDLLPQLCAARLDGCVPEGTDWRKEYGFYLRTRQTPGEQMLYIMRVLFRPTCSDYRFFHLPRGLHSLYPVLRPLRLCLKGLWH